MNTIFEKKNAGKYNPVFYIPFTIFSLFLWHVGQKFRINNRGRKHDFDVLYTENVD